MEEEWMEGCKKKVGEAMEGEKKSETAVVM